MLIIDRDRRDYAAFLSEADDPVEERRLVQLRIISRFALRNFFGALDSNEYDKFPDQPLTLLEALVAFVHDQKAHWGDASHRDLSGTAGGDGDWAKETLGFGLMVENEYHGVYRIWSRPWLVTK